MHTLDHLLTRNKNWAKRIRDQQPDFFHQLAEQQSPQIVWFGCSDSRVPATEIVDVMPGEIFVHRNIANQIIPTDMNSQSVLQFAVETLQVKHAIVCGHYGCGGVQAALQDNADGLVNSWILSLKEQYRQHQDALSHLDDTNRLRRLCELNVIRQVEQLAHTSTVRKAWGQQQPLTLHGWIYDVANGILHDLDVSMENNQQLKHLQTIRQQLINE